MEQKEFILCAAINYNGTIINSFYDDYIYSDENDSDVYDYDGGGLMAADIDNDGKSKFANKIMNTLIVFDSNGTRLWSDTSQRPNFGGASFGDLTGDGNPEIIFGDLSFYNCGRTYIYDSIKGTIINSWEIYPNCSMHLPKRGNALENMVADINNDGKNDIIASVWEVDFTGEFLTGYAYVYAWNSNGSIINGFPIYIPGQILLSPVLEDIDKDGKYEIIVSSDGAGWGHLNPLLFVLDTDGNVNPNKKDWTQLNHDAQHTGCYDCDKLSNQLSCISNQSIGDINGDWNITQEDATRLISIIYNVSDPYYHTNDSTLMCCLDVNMDRSLTMADITKINRIVLGIDQSPGKCPLFCGDIDGSKKVNALDVTRLINYLYKGGVAPVSMWSANVNGDSAVNALDVTYLINYLYKGGASLKCAEPAKGLGANPTAGKTYSQAASELKSAQKTSVP